MKRYYVRLELVDNTGAGERKHLYLYAYSEEQIREMLREYEIISVEENSLDEEPETPMKVYTKITMSQGVLDTVDVSLECPEVLDTSDEHWDNGFKVFEHEVDAPAVVAEEPETLPDTLWVYDLARFVEVHAPTEDEARAEIDRLESQTGFEFQLARNWDEYQEEYEQQRDKGDQ